MGHPRTGGEGKAVTKQVEQRGESGEVVRGYLHEATGDPVAALVLTHGAGGNANGAVLVALAGELAAHGVAVLRYDLPFRQVRPHGPPSPSSATRDQQGLRDAAGVLRRLIGGRVMVGGQSYGGRQASMLAAADANSCDGLLLMSYPLHAPGKAQMRDAHFPQIGVPALFVQGSKDPFASVDEMKNALQLLKTGCEHMVIEGAGHDLGWSGRKRITDLPVRIAEAFVVFFELGRG
jgi:predicted alpha/beta-hydrolase family hydrolase